jgi:hypothetical protein
MSSAAQQAPFERPAKAKERELRGRRSIPRGLESLQFTVRHLTSLPAVFISQLPVAFRLGVGFRDAEAV